MMQSTVETVETTIDQLQIPSSIEEMVVKDGGEEACNY